MQLNSFIPRDVWLITWVDSVSMLGWKQFFGQKLGLYTVQTIGYIVSETCDMVAVSSSYGAQDSIIDMNEMFDGCMTIPVGSIKSRIKLNIDRKQEFKIGKQTAKEFVQSRDYLPQEFKDKLFEDLWELYNADEKPEPEVVSKPPKKVARRKFKR